jgi:hypothetical protein
MKFRNKKIVGVLMVLLVNLVGAQPALAVNPQDISYSTNIDKYYNSVIVVEVANYTKLLNQPTYSAARTSAKYKAWVKKVNSSGSKISAAYSKLAALTAGPSYTKSDALLKIYSASSLNFYATYKKALAKKKSMEADTTLLNDLSAKEGAYGEAWLISYQQEFSVANLSAPTTAPSVKFTSEGPRILQATLVDTDNFNQESLRITSYKYEWYKGVDLETPIDVNTFEVNDTNRSFNFAFQMTNTEDGMLYTFRVQASNSFGSGPWSTKFGIVMR